MSQDSWTYTGIRDTL